MPQTPARLLLLAAALSLTACKDDSNKPTTIADVREVQRMDLPAAPAPGDAERLGFRMPTPAEGMAPGMAPGMGAPGMNAPFAGSDMINPASAFEVSYELPSGWSEATPNPMRKPNLIVAGNPQAECYVTILPGSGGGPLDNINRWRGQMDLPPLSEAELNALPRAETLGEQAFAIDLSGDFHGMSAEAQSNFRLIGRVLELQGHAVFVKMTGPAELIAAELKNFDEFAASLQVAQGIPSAAPAAPPMAPPLAPGATLPAGHPPMDATPEPTAARPAAPKLAWSTPAGWSDKPSSSMRAVTFGFGDNPANECYVIILPGDAGGAEANINRWRAQLGLAPVSALEIAELASIPVLGKQCPLIEGQGAYTGMSGPTLENAAMLGTICDLGTHSVFIKMTGVAPDVAAQRTAFETFCASLKVEP